MGEEVKSTETKSEEKKNVKREPRSNQKLKIMYLMKILMECTDETHDITLAEIVEKLKSYGVTAERKSLYSDIENLRLYGMDILGTQYDRTFHYQVVNRQFELAELKLLVDAVQASKFITEKKSKDLIEKIEGYASKYEAEKLHRQVSVAGRAKTMNERIYYSVDSIHEAISENKQITFQYFSWNLNKKMELKHDGAYYVVSPWALCWDDEKYYLIGYDQKDEKIKHFRVVKMVNTSVTHHKRSGRAAFRDVNMTEYKNRLFGMFEGENVSVTLLCENSFINVLLDRFGLDIPIIKKDENHFQTTVKVSASKLFFGWAMLPGVKIIGPEHVVDMMKDEINRLQDVYF